jgi:hypothetical protein
MERKLEVMATRPELALWLVRPTFWEDEYGRVAVNPAVSGCQVRRIPLVGSINDPHPGPLPHADLWSAIYPSPHHPRRGGA